MRRILTIAACALFGAWTAAIAPAQTTVIDADFSKGDIDAQGWKADGAWETYKYPDATNNPGWIVRFKANEPDGTLSKTFDEIRNPTKLELSLDVGWGWGDADQGADLVSFMLLDADGNGYVFETRRVKAEWAVQWAPVKNRVAPGDKTWANEEIDGTQKSVKDGGGLNPLTITRDAQGRWTFSGKAWNQGAGASVAFTDATITSFNELVLIGTKNFDEQVYGNIVLRITE